MVAKSNTSAATQQAAQRLEKVIDSHRSYFPEWRSDKFERLSDASRTQNPPNALKNEKQNKTD